MEGGRKGMKGYGETERDGVMRRGSKEGGRERLVLFPKRAACDAAGQERYRRSEDGDAPSVRRALPPVGWQRTVEQEPQRTTVWAWEKTVVMLKHPVMQAESQWAIGKGSGASGRTGTLDIHEVGVGRLYEPLELVGLLGDGGRRVEEVNGERLHREARSLAA